MSQCCYESSFYLTNPWKGLRGPHKNHTTTLCANVPNKLEMIAVTSDGDMSRSITFKMQ